MAKTLTVFTPSYNRANLLPRLYDSLIKQTNQDFLWMIIDDGSIDDTKSLVTDWQKENKIEILYYYKENGGLHTGYNWAIERTFTELIVCIDSDDLMPEEAVGKILSHWNINKSDEYAGIIGLDYYFNGKSIGGELPKKKSIFFREVKTKYSYLGDTKLVHRTELLKPHVPMPTFGAEKNFNPSYIFLKVDLEKPLLVLNENLCFVDYQPDGMTNNILRQYRNSPNSFNELRKLYMVLPDVKKTYIFKQYIHFVSGSIFAKDKKWLNRCPSMFFGLLALPFGILLNIYIRIKTKN